MREKIPYWTIALLTLAGLALVVIPNGMRFTGFLFLGAAALWLSGAFLRRWARDARMGRLFWRAFLMGTALVLALLMGIEAAVVFQGETDNSGVPVDAVIILGAGVNGETPSAALQSRIDAAAEYLQYHPGVPVVLSGGQGPGESITEAEAMRRALSVRWELYEDSPIWLLEERSTNTAENFRYSKELLAANGVNTETAVIAVVTNDFHCFRAHMIARREGLHVVGVSAELPWWWLTANYYVREAFAVVKTALFD